MRSIGRSDREPICGQRVQTTLDWATVNWSESGETGVRLARQMKAMW